MTSGGNLNPANAELGGCMDAVTGDVSPREPRSITAQARTPRFGARFALNATEPVVVHAVGLLEHAAEPGVAIELEKTARAIAREVGLDPARVQWHLADGDPCSVLIRATVAPIAADLLVVGSRGQGAHTGLLLGSTSLELAEHATVPLVIVPTGREGR